MRLSGIKSIFLLVAAVACLTLSVAGAESGGNSAAGPSSGERELTLNLWNIPPKGSTNINNKVTRAVFDLFLMKHPHIKVKALVPLRIQGPAAEGNEFLAVAGGMAPDVFSLYGRKVGDYIDQGFLAPLNDNFKRDFADRGIDYCGSDAPDKIWELCVRDGNIYAVPNNYYFMALMYRKDLFAKVGLNPSAPPKTWDEMWTVGKRLTYIPAKEPDAQPDSIPVYGFSLLRGVHQGWHFLQFVWSGGGEVVRSYQEDSLKRELVPVKIPYFPFRDYGIRLVNEDYYEKMYSEYNVKMKPRNLTGPLKWKLVTNEPGGVAALEFYRKLTTQKWIRSYDDNGKVLCEFDITPEMEKDGIALCPVSGKKYDLGNPGVKQRIYEGITRSSMGNEKGQRYECAMQIMTMGEVTNIDWAQWSLTAFPTVEGKAVKSFIAGGYLAVNRTSPPERQEAAWQYIKFMNSEEAVKIRVKAMVENGMAQYVRPFLLKKYGYEDYYRELPKEWIKIYEEVSQTAEVEPYCRGFTHVMTVGLGHPIDMAILYPDKSCQELMDDTCERVNATILGQRPENEMKRYRTMAYILIPAAFLLIGFAFWFILKVRMKQSEKEALFYIPGVSRKRITLYSWSFMSVAVLSIATWQYYPILKGSIMAFQDYKILSGGTFTGPQNFIEVLLEENFYKFLFQTFFYVILSITMGFFVPILLAVLLTEIPKGKVFFRTLYYLPAVTTGLVTLFLWKQLMFDPSPDGALNWVLGLFGISAQKYLEDPGIAMACIIIPGIWAGAGPGCLIYLAAFKTIPDEMYEAADLDGAGFICKFRHVLFPGIKALILINFIGAFVGAFQASENIFVMTGGGPVNSTMTVGLDIWYHSFMYLNFGYATAEAWILGAMLIGFTVLQLRILNKVQFKRAGV